MFNSDLARTRVCNEACNNNFICKGFTMKKCWIFLLASFFFTPHASILAASKNKELIPLSGKTAHATTLKNGITMHAKLLNKKEIHRIFNGRGSTLFNKRNPIVPIQLTVLNDSGKEIIFNPSTFNDLPSVELSQVLARLQYNTPLRMGLLTVAGFGLSCLVGLATPILCAGLLPHAFGGWESAMVLGTLIGAGTAAVTFLSSSGITIYCGVQYARENKELKSDLKHHSPKTEISIKPNYEFSCIVFADGRKLKDQFTLGLIDAQQDAVIPFTLNLKPV